MKNIGRISFIIVSIAINAYLIITPYEYKQKLNVNYSHNLLAQLIPTSENFYLEPFWALNLFIPSIIVGISFSWKLPFSFGKKMMLYGLLLICLFVSFYYVMIDAGSNGYKTTFILDIIQLYNLLSIVWLVLLALPLNERISFIHWPFDSREERKTT